MLIIVPFGFDMFNAESQVRYGKGPTAKSRIMFFTAVTLFEKIDQPFRRLCRQWFSILTKIIRLLSVHMRKWYFEKKTENGKV